MTTGSGTGRAGVVRALAGVVTFLVAMTGCAAIPTSGPVTEVAEDAGFGQSTVRYSPALPADGAEPGEIVRGYLDAMLAYPSSNRTAAAFLTPSAADEWQRQDGVTIYDDAQVVSLPEGDRARAGDSTSARVSIDAARAGALDSQGRYTSARDRTSVDYELVQVDGQWRIANPQPGLLVTAKFFADYFRPFVLYFFDRTGRRLVPQPVHLLVEDRLAAALVTALTQGDPSRQVRTFVPGPDDLRATVTVDRRVADVGFTAGPRKESDVERLSAQVVWTLRQVPGVSSVRISVGSSAVRPRNVAEQPLSSWAEFGAGDDAGGTHALVGDRVVEVDAGDVARLEGPWGASAGGAAAVAVTDQRLALVAKNRASVRIASLTGKIRRTLTGTDLIDPVTDVDGQFWLVDSPGGDSRVRVVAAAPANLDSGSLKGLDVRSLDISPEGARYVVTTGTGADASVRVGRVVRDARGAPTGLARPRRVDVGGVQPRSAVWADDVRVSFLASTDAGIQVQTALIDGSTGPISSSNVGAVLPDVDTSRLVIGSGSDASTYATDPRGRMWYLSERGTWQLAAGDPVRSLGHSR